ncbi:cell wall-binding repeat-containing protein [Catenulispora yoronensis]
MTAEIKRVLAPGGIVYVLGGVNAVTPKAVAALGLPGLQVRRVSGSDRFETSLAIADEIGNPTGNVVLATGNDFPDALSAGPLASVFGGGTGTPAAILLTNDRTMSPAVADYAAHAHSVAAVGGQAVAAVTGARLWNVDRGAEFAGRDRYDTAARVAGMFPAPMTVGVATGTQFADALTGAGMVAAARSPLLLTEPGGCRGIRGLRCMGWRRLWGWGGGGFWGAGGCFGGGFAGGGGGCWGEGGVRGWLVVGAGS